MEHINVLELVAVWRGITVLLPEVKQVHILVETDNKMAAAFIRRMRGVKNPRCRYKAQQIWKWLLNRGCWISSQYLPGEENVTADKLSRDMAEGMEWMLDKNICGEE